MAATNEMKGARLEYVLKPVTSLVTRTVTKYDAKTKKLRQEEVKDDKRKYFMLYLPSGHSYRLTQEEVVRRGYNKPPSILNFDRVVDNRSAAGRFKFAMNDTARSEAYAELENEVIKLCRRKTGYSEGEMNVSGSAVLA